MNDPATRHMPFASLARFGRFRYRLVEVTGFAVTALVSLLLAVALALPALAQERTFLSKAQVEELASGKKWTLVRKADQQNIRWELSSGGRVFGRNLSVSQSDSGTWLVNESGQLCVKWRGSSTDRCLAILKDGTAMKMVDSADLAGTFADLTVE